LNTPAREKGDSGILQMMIRHLFLALVLSGSFLIHTAAGASEQSRDQLLRLAYDSAVTKQKREFFVYLPFAYATQAEMKWPVILFLHGHGQRGNGLGDLDYILRHGPLMEAWIQRRDLPFIIISPQLPVLGEIEALEERKNQIRPRRLEHGVPERNYGYPSDLPVQRQNSEDFPPGAHDHYNPYSEPDGLPAGWSRIDTELIDMVDRVLKEFRTDPQRVYLTGISLGGFGAFHMAAKYPDRWAAMATVVGTGRLEHAEILARARLPIWMFGGGKDTVIKPHWLYEMARALEAAGHPAIRFTVHEDMDHDAWKRVYEGEDLFNWFLRYSSDMRPARAEKSK
jgi:predicted peptidase